MARRLEEEESYWPGFVDALSTIVMVVTFLLIILGVAIFAISTQVSKAMSDNEAATAQAKSELEASQQVVEQQTAQAQVALQSAAAAQQAAQSANAQVEALQLASQTQASRLAEELVEQQTETQRIAAELSAEREAVAMLQQQAEQTRSALDQAVAELQAKEAEAAELSAAVDAMSTVVSQDQQSDAEQQQTAAELAQQAEQAQAELDQTREALEQKEQEVAELTQTVATLMEAATVAVMQDEQVTADNAMRISSSTLAIDPTLIEVTAQQVDEQLAAVEVTSAQEVLTIRFPDGAIDMDAEAAAQASAFVDLNREVVEQHAITLWSFYDGSSLSVTQAKRTAYFRLLAARNVLLAAGIEPSSMEINVRVADQPGDIDTVKTFLQ